MVRKQLRAPKYRHYKPKNLAVVRINGKDHYLGRYESAESWEKYHRLVADWLAGKETVQPDATTPDLSAARLTIDRLIYLYLQFAKQYYSRDGKPTSELTDMKLALRPLRALFGTTPANEFGPKRLKQVRQFMIDQQDLSRSLVNHRIGRIKRVFRWATEEELVPPSIYHGLQAVRGLSYGRTSAREAPPIQPVPQAWVDATLPFMSRQVAAMVQLQLLGAMRPGEVVLMRACDIDMSGDVWLYRPQEHKNRWRGHERVIALGPRAQAIIEPFLGLSTTAYLFSPREAEAERNAQRRRQRKTPMTPSQAARKPKRRPKRAKRERYDRDSYRRAIKYAIKKANRQRQQAAKERGERYEEIPDWCPLQLRHSRATEIRKAYGIEAAQVSLGHTRADVTQVYAERNIAAAVRVAREIG